MIWYQELSIRGLDETNFTLFIVFVYMPVLCICRWDLYKLVPFFRPKAPDRKNKLSIFILIVSASVFAGVCIYIILELIAMLF